MRPDGSDARSLTKAFLAEHEKAYGHADASMPMEIVSIRVTARIKASELSATSGAAAEKASTDRNRDVWFTEGGPERAVIVERGQMPVGETLMGPAVIEQSDSTTLLWPGWSAVQDDAGNLILEKTA